MHAEGLRDWKSSLNSNWLVKSNGKIGAGHAARAGKIKENLYRVFVGKPEIMNPLGRPRHRAKGNIKIYLKN
jgi:hypothetical protein